MPIHHTAPEDARVAGFVVLDDEWEITTIPLVDRCHGLDNGGPVCARITWNEGLAVAKRYGGQLATVAQLKAKAKLPGAIVLKPFLGTPIAETTLHHSKLHDADCYRQALEAGWTGQEPVVGWGKHWVDADDDEETADTPTAWSHIWGWDKDGAGPGEAVWQPRAGAHKGGGHFDDGTTVEIVRRRGTVSNEDIYPDDDTPADGIVAEIEVMPSQPPDTEPVQTRPQMLSRRPNFI